MKPILNFASRLNKTVVLFNYGPFVYRLGHKIFILGRGVRFPYGLQTSHWEL